MPDTLITIEEAASLSAKSAQTIRRALKAHKLKSKKQKTPQGFNYMVIKEDLISFYKLKNLKREHRSIKNDNEEVTKNAFDFSDFKETMQNLLEENKKDRETFMRFMKAFQDKFVVLENQLKLIEQPKKKWFNFWE